MPKTLKERDAMTCRSCGNEERASEGYPCVDCGTFICLPCTVRGTIRCRGCEERAAAEPPKPAGPSRFSWPEH